MPAEQRSDTEKELGEIRREVIEARNLVIKTDNLLKNLHAEVKGVGKKQEEFQRRQWISSAVAYVLFAALCGAGAVTVVSLRTSSAAQERERLEKSVVELTAQLEKQRSEVAAVQGAQRAAGEIYRMMTSLPGDERMKGVDALLKLDTSKLTPLEKQALNDRAQLLREEIGQAAFERGKAAYRRNELATAVTELSRFVALNPRQPDLLESSYYLGTALSTLKKHDQAVPHLARFVSGDRRAKNRDYAMLLLAQSYEQTGQLDKALETAREALGSYPNTAFAGQLRARISSAKRLQSAGADSAAVQAATISAGRAPAQAPRPAAPAAPAPAGAKPPEPAPGAVTSPASNPAGQ